MNRSIRNWLKRYLTAIYASSSKERRMVQENAVTHDPQARILDLGCREGDGTIRMGARAGSQYLYGVDYNSRVLKLAAEKGITTLLADLNRSIPLCDNSFDIIIASDVLEHLVEPFIFTAEMYRVLRPGGYMILDTPNLASWHNIFALLIGLQPFSGPNITNMEDGELGVVRDMHRTDHGLAVDGDVQIPKEKDVNRHIVVIAYRSLVNLIKRQGFMIVEARGFGYYPFPGMLARIFQQINPAHSHHAYIKAVKPPR